MHWIDIVFAIPLLWGLYKGITKGFILQACSLGALFLSTYLSFRFSNYISVFATEKLSLSFKYLPVVIFIVLFILVLIGMYFFARALDNIVKNANLGWLNKTSGALLGISKFALIVGFIVFAINAVNDKASFLPEGMREKSFLYHPLLKFAEVAIPAIKGSELTKQIKDAYDRDEVAEKKPATSKTQVNLK